MTAREVDELFRRIDHLTRAASRIRAHLADLHGLAWEPAVHTTEPSRAGGFESRPPPGAARDHPNIGTKPPERIGRRDQAHYLWERAVTDLSRCEAVLVGLERAVGLWFMVTAAVEPTRGPLIRKEEFGEAEEARERRRARGEYTPTRLINQPPHPDKRRGR